MNHRNNVKSALLAFLLPIAAQADLFITNFDTLNAPVSASGVWKNYTTGTDLTIPVSLTQTGEGLEMIRPAFPEGTHFEILAHDTPGDRDLKTPLTDPSVPDDYFTLQTLTQMSD